MVKKKRLKRNVKRAMIRRLRGSKKSKKGLVNNVKKKPVDVSKEE